MHLHSVELNYLLLTLNLQVSKNGVLSLYASRSRIVWQPFIAKQLDFIKLRWRGCVNISYQNIPTDYEFNCLRYVGHFKKGISFDTVSLLWDKWCPYRPSSSIRISSMCIFHHLWSLGWLDLGTFGLKLIFLQY